LERHETVDPDDAVVLRVPLSREPFRQQLTDDWNQITCRAVPRGRDRKLAPVREPALDELDAIARMRAAVEA